MRAHPPANLDGGSAHREQRVGTAALEPGDRLARLPQGPARPDALSPFAGEPVLRRRRWPRARRDGGLGRPVAGQQAGEILQWDVRQPMARPQRLPRVETTEQVGLGIEPDRFVAIAPDLPARLSEGIGGGESEALGGEASQEEPQAPGALLAGDLGPKQPLARRVRFRRRSPGVRDRLAARGTGRGRRRSRTAQQRKSQSGKPECAECRGRARGCAGSWRPGYEAPESPASFAARSPVPSCPSARARR